MKTATDFLPVTRAESEERYGGAPDFVYVCGDAYVDHPSFGAALISRVLVDKGYSVAMLSQPDYKSCEDFMRFGKPRLGFLVSSGNIDSMVAHYTVAKKKRSDDYYSPGGKAGKRPDRAVIVYCNRIREAYGDVPVIIGGLEASLRRCAHYDYWDNKVRRSILVDSRADILSYGMGEKSITRIAELLNKGVPVKKIRDVRGTAYLCKRGEDVHYEVAGGTVDGEPFGYDYDEIKTDKEIYGKAYATQYRNNDAAYGKAVVEYYGDRMLVVNPPQTPLTREEMDKVYNIPFMRTYHPMYESEGGVPAIEEVKFSITHNRGCFGGCNFCAIAYHQGRVISSRSIESVVSEARLIASMPDFKGYIHDVGGPTANFRHPACKRQKEGLGACPDRHCLVPTPCKNIDSDHSEYIELLKRIEEIDGIKKVFIRSGIRYDYMLLDKKDDFFRKLVNDHVSGQLKVAPEHCSSHVLSCMGKPDIDVYDRFREKYFSMSKEAGKNQFVVPYLMSSHPGSRLEDAVELALYTKKIGLNPEQVQDFYPTPGTASTVMYYTGKDPLTGKEVYVSTDYREKKLQRALLQYRRPENRALVIEALKKAGREDLIGFGPDCLIAPQRKKGKSQDKKSDGHTEKKSEKKSQFNRKNKSGNGSAKGRNNTQKRKKK